ncbi:unnamed protein product [Schistocephalus solidus]|uniref:C2H2-type domain-containing protein n=1 Tax=Schistocephalus solidus TaxID=70667 RepID=A0A183SFH1_SCHSO|nr:unnamed protein product [Schistocephalus solidus]
MGHGFVLVEERPELVWAAYGVAVAPTASAGGAVKTGICRDCKCPPGVVIITMPDIKPIASTSSSACFPSYDATLLSARMTTAVGQQTQQKQMAMPNPTEGTVFGLMKSLKEQPSTSTNNAVWPPGFTGFFSPLPQPTLIGGPWANHQQRAHRQHPHSGESANTTGASKLSPEPADALNATVSEVKPQKRHSPLEGVSDSSTIRGQASGTDSEVEKDEQHQRQQQTDELRQSFLATALSMMTATAAGPASSGLMGSLLPPETHKMMNGTKQASSEETNKSQMSTDLATWEELALASRFFPAFLPPGGSMDSAPTDLQVQDTIGQLGYLQPPPPPPNPSGLGVHLPTSNPFYMPADLEDHTSATSLSSALRFCPTASPANAFSSLFGCPNFNFLSTLPQSSRGDEDFCELCQKHFCNKYYLRKHKTDVHGIPTEPFTQNRRRDLPSKSFAPVDSETSKPALPMTSIDWTSVLPYSAPPLQSDEGTLEESAVCRKNSLDSQVNWGNQPPIQTGNNENAGCLTMMKSDDSVFWPKVTKQQKSLPVDDTVPFDASLFSLPVLKPPESSGTQRNSSVGSFGSTSYTKESNKVELSEHATFIPPTLSAATEGSSVTSANSVTSSKQTGGLNAGALDMFKSSMAAAKLADRVVCDLCRKELCNKYFLRTHKIKVHGLSPQEVGGPVPRSSLTKSFEKTTESAICTNMETSKAVTTVTSGVLVQKPGPLDFSVLASPFLGCGNATGGQPDKLPCPSIPFGSFHGFPLLSQIPAPLGGLPLPVPWFPMMTPTSTLPEDSNPFLPPPLTSTVVTPELSSVNSVQSEGRTASVHEEPQTRQSLASLPEPHQKVTDQQHFENGGVQSEEAQSVNWNRETQSSGEERRAAEPVHSAIQLMSANASVTCPLCDNPVGPRLFLPTHLTSAHGLSPTDPSFFIFVLGARMSDQPHPRRASSSDIQEIAGPDAAPLTDADSIKLTSPCDRTPTVGNNSTAAGHFLSYSAANLLCPRSVSSGLNSTPQSITDVVDVLQGAEKASNSTAPDNSCGLPPSNSDCDQLSPLTCAVPLSDSSSSSGSGGGFTSSHISDANPLLLPQHPALASVGRPSLMGSPGAATATSQIFSPFSLPASGDRASSAAGHLVIPPLGFIPLPVPHGPTTVSLSPCAFTSVAGEITPFRGPPQLVSTTKWNPVQLAATGLTTSTGSKLSQVSGTGQSRKSPNQMRVLCNICNKWICNKYFLRTHKANKHGITEGSTASPNLPSSNTMTSALTGTTAKTSCTVPVMSNAVSSQSCRGASLLPEIYDEGFIGFQKTAQTNVAPELEEKHRIPPQLGSGLSVLSMCPPFQLEALHSQIMADRRAEEKAVPEGSCEEFFALVSAAAAAAKAKEDAQLMQADLTRATMPWLFPSTLRSLSEVKDFQPFFSGLPSDIFDRNHERKTEAADRGYPLNLSLKFSPPSSAKSETVDSTSPNRTPPVKENSRQKTAAEEPYPSHEARLSGEHKASQRTTRHRARGSAAKRDLRREVGKPTAGSQDCHPRQGEPWHNLCQTCGAWFNKRSQLEAHLYSTGHRRFSRPKSSSSLSQEALQPGVYNLSIKKPDVSRSPHGPFGTQLSSESSLPSLPEVVAASSESILSPTTVTPGSFPDVECSCSTVQETSEPSFLRCQTGIWWPRCVFEGPPGADDSPMELRIRPLPMGSLTGSIAPVSLPSNQFPFPLNNIQRISETCTPVIRPLSGLTETTPSM